MSANNELVKTMEEMVSPTRGILAMDEGAPAIAKRFDAISVELSEENRRAYRSALLGTPGISEFINGVILFEETLTQRDDQGQLLPELTANQDIVSGIKVDKSLVSLPNTKDEKITQGLD